MKQKTKSRKILVIHGPNLSLLGKREPHIYGRVTLNQINRALRKLAKEKGFKLKIAQSNYEGKIVDLIAKAKKDKFCALLINPAAYTHTSVAIRDAISASGIPTVEVHLSNIYTREDFRQRSLISPVAKGQICGFGLKSYLLGLEAIEDILNKS
ncbi:MAG: type II 3-dehydroquinate dehydratase [Candidatus Omnitrophica bacterium]|nr:type II 3-dehydroquinate dehydratase [Candidatus Omnitrophota bacterium]MCM8799565.1 type II 3-dehydroquinate dehydratase [Candidatus Omnitrophota bacterium]